MSTKCRSIAECHAAGTPTIGEIVRAGEGEKIATFIELNIAALAVFCNLGNSITAQQMSPTIDLIMSEYGFLTIADVNLIFRMAKLGQWSEMYGRLDGQMILIWFGKYAEERCNYFAEKSIQEAASMGMRANDTAARVKEMAYRTIEKLKANDKKQKP